MAKQLRTFQSNFTGGELAPSMWSRPDVSKYQTAVKELRNFLIRPQGGVRNRGGTVDVGPILDSNVRNKQIAFEIGPGESYILDFGHLTLRFIRDGAYILDSASTMTVFEISDEAPAVFTVTGHSFNVGDRLFLQYTGDKLLDGDFYTVSAVDVNTLTLIDRWGVPVDRVGRPVLYAGQVTKDYVVTTPYTADQIGAVNIAQDQATGYVLHRAHAPRRLVRTAPDNWSLTAETFTPDAVTPTGVTATAAVAVGVTVPVTYRYKVAAIMADNGEESLPSTAATCDNDLSIAGNKNEVAWSTVAGAARYVVYKEDNGVYGFIAGTTGLTITDENITADLSDGPQEPRNPFTGAGNYPGVGTFFEQRLWLASTANNPAGVWASQSVNPRNFQISSPLKESDAITFRIRANKVQQIEALVPSEQLLLFTRSGEWTTRGGDDQGYLTPLNPVLRQRAYRGSTAVQPVLAGDFVVHVQRGGTALRDFGLSREVASTDMTLLAKHLIRRTAIVAVAYQQKPDSIVWVVTGDGRLLALTYMLEHDIWGWSRMEIGGNGFVEGVTVVAEDDDDAVYLQVRRSINGGPVRYIERLDTSETEHILEAHYLDAGRKIVLDIPGNEVTGLFHLEGQRVSCLIDGNVFHNLPVQQGRIELPNAATYVSVGLPYTARLRTLDLDIGAVRELGSMLGRHKTATEIRLRVEDTRGIFVSHEHPDRANEYKQRAAEAWGEAIQLYTGDIAVTPEADWTTGGEVVVEQREPLPAVLNGLLVDWEFGE